MCIRDSVLKCVFLIFRDFQFSRHIPGPTVCISHFSRFSVFRHFSSRQVDVSHFPWFSVFLPYSTSYSGHFKFSTFFSFPCHISRPKVCISHFPWFSVFSPYSRSYCVHFSFFTFCSDFIIFQVFTWMFQIFHDFQFSCIFHVLQWTLLNFPPFSVFLAVFHLLKCVFLIFRDFQSVSYTHLTLPTKRIV